MGKILTVSIAAYNVENYINECLNSLKINKLDELEVLIVDDGSTDNTKDIVNKYCNRYPETFKLIDKKNGGWGSTLNSSMLLAEGKYFKQLDGDDFFNTTDLDSFISFLNQTDTDVVYTPFYYFYEDYVMKQYEEKKLDGILCISDFLKMYPKIQMHSCCFKTDLLRKNKIKISENCFYTDQEYVLKALYYSQNVSFYNKPIYCYRLGREGQSVSMKSYFKHYKELEKVIIELSEFFETKNDINQFFFRRIALNVSTQYDIYVKMGNKKNELLEFNNRIKKYKYYGIINLR